MGLQTVESAIIGGDIIAIILNQAVQSSILYGSNAAAANYRPSPLYFGGIIPVTARLQEVYQYRAEVTRYAIESAAMSSDHIILYPIEVEGSFQTSNWEPGMAQHTLTVLEGIWKARQQFTLLTQHKQLPNMVLREFRAENEAPKWGKLDFHAVFQEIPKVAVQSSSATPDKTQATPQTGGPDVSKSANPPVNNGVQAPGTPTAIQSSAFNLPPSLQGA